MLYFYFWSNLSRLLAKKTVLATWQLIWIQRAISHFSLEAVEAKTSLAEVLKSLQLSETKLKSMESDLTQKNSEVETLRSQLQNRTTQNAEAACQTASSAAETSRSSPSSKSTAMFEQQVRLSFSKFSQLRHWQPFVLVEDLQIWKIRAYCINSSPNSSFKTRVKG